MKTPQSSDLSWLCLPGPWLLAQKREERWPCCSALWKATVFPGNQGGGVGQRGDSQLWAREGCPRLAVSLGSQGRVPAPPATVWSGLCHLGPVRDTLVPLIFSSVCPNIEVMRAKVMGKVKGHCLALCQGGFATELLLHGQALAREDGRKHIEAGLLAVV